MLTPPFGQRHVILWTHRLLTHAGRLHDLPCDDGLLNLPMSFGPWAIALIGAYLRALGRLLAIPHVRFRPIPVRSIEFNRTDFVHPTA